MSIFFALYVYNYWRYAYTYTICINILISNFESNNYFKINDNENIEF